MSPASIRLGSPASTNAESASLPVPALLFCPADRPDRYRKAANAADVVVLDLEDAVADGSKAVAREALVKNPIDPARTIVRISPVGTGDHIEDLRALHRTAYRCVMLAKTESAEQVAGLREWWVVPLCETPLGVIHAEQIAAAANTIALMWGAEDLVAAMSGRGSRFDSGSYRAVAVHARSRVLLAAKAHHRQAIDAVYLDIGNPSGLASESEDAAASGFDIKACIHPSQAAVIRKAFHPDERTIAWAERVVASAGDGGVTQVDGHMVDGPILRQARQVLSAATGRRG